MAFAERALALRFTDIASSGMEPSRLLTCRRPEDVGDDLWSVMNRVQENLLRGGISRRSASGRTDADAAHHLDQRRRSPEWRAVGIGEGGTRGLNNQSREEASIGSPSWVVKAASRGASAVALPLPLGFDPCRCHRIRASARTCAASPARRRSRIFPGSWAGASARLRRGLRGSGRAAARSQPKET